MQFDLYVPREGWLQQLDPRTKLLLTVVSLMACLLFQKMAVLGAVLLLFHLLLLTSAVPWRQLRWLWGRMLPLTVMILLLQPFFASGGTSPILWQIGPFRWTMAGLLSGLFFALRVNSMAFVAAGLLFVTEPSSLVQGLVKLGLPFEWGMTVSLAIRYLPTTYGLYQSIYEAQQARGWDPRRGQFLRQIRDYLPMLVAVMIAALQMADNLGMALAARGFGVSHGVQRTSLRDISFRPLDWAMTISLFGLGVLLLVLRFG